MNAKNVLHHIFDFSKGSRKKVQIYPLGFRIKITFLKKKKKKNEEETGGTNLKKKAAVGGTYGHTYCYS